MNKLYAIYWMWEGFHVRTFSYWSREELDAEISHAKECGWTLRLKEDNDCHMIYEAY